MLSGMIEIECIKLEGDHTHKRLMTVYTYSFLSRCVCVHARAYARARVPSQGSNSLLDLIGYVFYIKVLHPMESNIWTVN
jgi:hypothetical protein